MKKIALILIIFILISLFLLKMPLRAQEISLTLDEALALALRDNRDILLKVEDVKKAKAEIAQAQASLFPALDFTSSRTYTKGYYSKDINQTTTQATLKQYLYKGGKIVNTIEKNKYKLEVAQALLDKEKLKIILNVKKTFYTLLLTEEFVNLNKAILENNRSHLDLIRVRYQNGQVPESDILEVKASLSNATQVYQTSLNQIESSQSLLNNLLYLDKEVKIKARDQLVCDPKEVAYDEAFLKAMKNRPEIRQYEAQIKTDKEAIEIAKSDNRPNIYASWDYYSRSHIAATTKRGWNDYNIIGITFSWPIFDGWQTKAKVEQAIVDLKETQLTQEKVLKDIVLELKNVYLSLKDAIVKLNVTEIDSIFYKDNFLTVEQRYNYGQASLLDKDDAELKYKISLFNKKQATYDYLIAKSSFDIATGGL